MIPITFEAYALRGKIDRLSYFAGYVAAIKPKDYWTFINMGERAGAPNVDAGMGLVSATYGSLDDLRLRTSVYHVPSILTSSYADAAKVLRVSEQVRVRASGQGMVQGCNGQNLLTGHSFSTFAAGAKVELLWGPRDIWGVFTQVGSAANYRAPYGQWIGYTKQIVKDFDRAGERAWQAGFTVDVARLGLPGLTFSRPGDTGRSCDRPDHARAGGLHQRIRCRRHRSACLGRCVAVAEIAATARPLWPRQSIPR